jgi:hypothetical protein
VVVKLNREHSEIPARADWGMKMVHEALRTPYTGGSSLIKGDRAVAPQLEKIVVDYGYTKPDTVVFNYWDERPAARVDHEQVKWIVMARPPDKTLLVVLQSWSADPVTASLSLKEDVLGFHLGPQVMFAVIST